MRSSQHQPFSWRQVAPGPSFCSAMGGQHSGGHMFAWYRGCCSAGAHGDLAATAQESRSAQEMLPTAETKDGKGLDTIAECTSPSGVRVKTEPIAEGTAGPQLSPGAGGSPHRAPTRHNPHSQRASVCVAGQSRFGMLMPHASLTRRAASVKIAGEITTSRVLNECYGVERMLAGIHDASLQGEF